MFGESKVMLLKHTKRFLNEYVGQYRIDAIKGEGRYGTCFLAEHNDKQVVIKILKQSIFRRNADKNIYEESILACLCHEGIPKLLDVMRYKGFYGLVLENKPGVTVEAMIFKQRHCFMRKEIHEIGRQLIEIISYLHSHEVVHRDIRIPNVIINNGIISLVDFGLARWSDEKRYLKDIDFSYLGDFLLYLIYSSYKKEGRRNKPWYEELQLTAEEVRFLKKLLKIESKYENIHEIKRDFSTIFDTEQPRKGD